MKNKILLIDDSQTQLDAFKKQLIEAGFEVETAINAIEGYEKIFKTIPDIILSDVIMPTLDGYQFCRLVKNNKLIAPIPVILLTVLDKNIDKFWGEKSGAEAFLSKNTEINIIIDKINSLTSLHCLTDTQKELIHSSNNNLLPNTVQDKLNNILNELLMQSIFLNEFSELNKHFTYEKVLVEKVFNLLSKFIDYNVAGIFFNKSDDNDQHILYLDINKKNISTFLIEKIKRNFFAAMPKIKKFNINEFGHEITNQNYKDLSESLISINSLKTQHIVPLIFDYELIGGIAFFSENEIDYTTFKFYNTMINEILILFKMKYMYSKIELLSITDGLTGLYNRRHFEYNIDRELKRISRYPSDLSLAIIDIDHFKNINDTFGHQFGDFVLQEVSQLLQKSFRNTDMIFRYGGEEFIAILTETSLENSLIPLDKLRSLIQNHKFTFNDVSANLTISIGVSSNKDNIRSVEQLVKSTDIALYKAKQSGRNKVVSGIYE